MASSETANSVASDKPTPQSEDEIHELAATEAPEVASASSENESDELVCQTQAQIDARADHSQPVVLNNMVYCLASSMATS